MLPNKAVAALLVWLLAGTAGAEPVSCMSDRVVFQTPSGPVGVSVEIADDESERAQGLMFRRELAENRGMLFIYDQPRTVSFWMRNTLIPLDLVFLDDTGTVRYIHRNARPLDETPIPGSAIGDPRPERLMVVEVAAGEADRLGLAVGQPMAHPRLPQDRAALPCG